MFALLPFGTIFAGRYRIGRSLASGGMGAVHEVEHLETGRRAALKVMLPHVLSGDGAREQFKSEARVAARLRSEHVVDVLDAGVDEATEMPYLVMELLEGEDLSARLRRGGPMPREEVVACLVQVARALDRVHRSGIVHRDLKPENLFLTTRDDGSLLVKVLDFGISKVLAEGATSALTFEARGTPVYMSPEQFTHEMKISPATDIYALGMVAYTLLAGGAYWSPEIERGMNVFLIARLAEKGPEEPASARARKRGVELPAAFDAWFTKVTAIDPKERFAGASSAVRALAEALDVPLSVPSERDRPSFVGPESRPPRSLDSGSTPVSDDRARGGTPSRNPGTPDGEARASTPGSRNAKGLDEAASTASTPPSIRRSSAMGLRVAQARPAPQAPSSSVPGERATLVRAQPARATLPRAARADDTPYSAGEPGGARGGAGLGAAHGPVEKERGERPDDRRALLPGAMEVGSDSEAAVRPGRERRRTGQIVAGGVLIAGLAAALGFLARPASLHRPGDTSGVLVADPVPPSPTPIVPVQMTSEISVAPAPSVAPEPTASATSSASSAPALPGGSIAASAQVPAKRPPQAASAQVPPIAPSASKKPRYTQD